MWRRYVGCVIGFVAGALLAWLIGLEHKLVALAGLGVAAVVMTFGERWGLVPPAEDVGKHQTLFSSERDRPRPRDTTGYLDSLDFTDEFKSQLWERVGSLTYDRGRKQRKGRAQLTNSPAASTCAKCDYPMKLDDACCTRCKAPREQVGSVDTV